MMTDKRLAAIGKRMDELSELSEAYINQMLRGGEV